MAETAQTEQIEVNRNVTSCQELMTLSSNLQAPSSLLQFETSTLTASKHFFSYIATLHSKENELLGKEEEQLLMNAGKPTGNNDEANDDLALSSSDADPFATDHDTDDPDYLPSDTDHTTRQEQQQENKEKRNENKKCRKRIRHTKSWRRNIIKSSRNSGVEYVDWKGNLKSERKLKPPCQNCRSKCNEKILEDERKLIFTSFWSLADINRQRDFISKFVTAAEKQRCRKRPKSEDEGEAGSSRRKTTYTYSLLRDGKAIPVCKTFFINTLSISGQMIQTVFAKIGSSGVVLEDRRGKACKNSKLDDSVKDSVRSHIDSFQTIESHYCRKSTERKYLPPTLNISRMYLLYQEYCQENNIPNIATESIYRQIFNTEYNISFFQPKKDWCDICHKYESLPVEQKTEMEEEYASHLKNRDLSRQLKINDKELACQSSTLCTAVFDLQQVLPVPKSNVGLAYYKLKLSTYNFTIFNLATKHCHCYMWYECIARRGSSEIGSCLLNFIEIHVAKGIKEFSFFSDNCAGQNRNKYLFALYSYLSQKHSVKIRHTFLQPGHTQTEGDCVHSVIEKASKHIPVYTPEQWYSLVRTAKRQKPYYTVYELSQKDVYDLKDLQVQTTINFDRDTNNDRIYISKLKVVEFNPEYPNCLFFKLKYDDNNFSKANLIQKGRRQLDGNINDIHLKLLYKAKLPLQKKKYDHLKFLCEKEVIASQYHDFFENLPYTSQQVNEEDSD